MCVYKRDGLLSYLVVLEDPVILILGVTEKVWHYHV